MITVINQPNYIPWRGYFDMIDDADLFLFFDDVQYTQRDWRNRNRIKTKNGLVWLTVPVKNAGRDTLIKDAQIDYSQNWQISHRRQITEAYRRAPFFKEYADPFFEIMDRGYDHLADMTIDMTLFLMKAFGITTPTRRTSEFNVEGRRMERLMNVLLATQSDTYLSGPAAKAYIDADRFRAHQIGLLWKNYSYAPYPQLGEGFEPQVTALDLLFNCGPEARRALKSRPPAYEAE